MLWGGMGGGLEVRRDGGGAVITGRFPYGAPAILADAPQLRREVFAARAFAARIEAGDEVHLLVGHDFDRPLASRSSGTLTVEDSADALTFEARLSPELGRVGYVTDFLGTLAAGLVRGLSPGFRVPEGGQQVTRDDAGVTRTITAADLVEISAVTRPAYPLAQIQARSWELTRPQARRFARWRA